MLTVKNAENILLRNQNSSKVDRTCYIYVFVCFISFLSVNSYYIYYHSLLILCHNVTLEPHISYHCCSLCLIYANHRFLEGVCYKMVAPYQIFLFAFTHIKSVKNWSGVVWINETIIILKYGYFKVKIYQAVIQCTICFLLNCGVLKCTFPSPALNVTKLVKL